MSIEGDNAKRPPPNKGEDEDKVTLQVVVQ